MLLKNSHLIDKFAIIINLIKYPI